MIPTTVHCAIVFPGMQMTAKAEMPRELLHDEGDLDGYATLHADYAKIYAVERDLLINPDDVRVDKDGCLMETLFAFGDVAELRPQVGYLQSHWLRGHMQECGWDDVGLDTLRALYRIARRRYDAVEGYKQSCMVLISFIGLWVVESTYDRLENTHDISGVCFAGEGKVVFAEVG